MDPKIFTTPIFAPVPTLPIFQFLYMSAPSPNFWRPTRPDLPPQRSSKAHKFRLSLLLYGPRFPPWPCPRFQKPRPSSQLAPAGHSNISQRVPSIYLLCFYHNYSQETTYKHPFRVPLYPENSFSLVIPSVATPIHYQRIRVLLYFVLIPMLTKNVIRVDGSYFYSKRPITPKLTEQNEILFEKPESTPPKSNKYGWHRLCEVYFVSRDTRQRNHIWQTGV